MDFVVDPLLLKLSIACFPLNGCDIREEHLYAIQGDLDS
jgi:hypothetical protein